MELNSGPRWAPLRSDPPAGRVLNTYYPYRCIDIISLLGTVVLGICYAIARYYGHVGVFCDISDLVVHLPERIIFRVNFGLVGGLLAYMAFPIHDIAASRVGGCLPKAGAGFQLVSGVGVILVGACGPEEMMPVHLAAAIMGFGGSGIAQIIYGIVFMHEDTQTQPQSARTIFIARCIISALFLRDTLAVAANDAEYAVEVKMKAKKKYAEEMLDFFHAADQSNDGYLTLDEFQQMLDDDRVKTWLSLMEIDILEISEFFYLLAGEDGLVSPQEFVRGILRCKGMARSQDVIAILHSTHRMHRELSEMRTKLNTMSKSKTKS